MVRARLLMIAVLAIGLLPRAALGSTNPAKIYLADEASSSILTFNADGSPGAPNFTVAVAPYDVAIDDSGDFWILSGKKGGARLAKYNADGTRCLLVIPLGQGEPNTVAADANGVYAAHAGLDILRFRTDGARISDLYMGGYAFGFAIDPSGKYYVSRYYYGSVRTFDEAGKPTTPTITHLNHPWAIALDASDNIYVTSLDKSAVYTITIYNANGTPTGVRFAIGNALPLKIAVDATGVIYVLNARGVQTYYSNGAPGPTTIPGRFTGMAVR